MASDSDVSPGVMADRMRSLLVWIVLLAAAPVIASEGTAHQVTWDQHSLLLDGKRTFIWGGEIHPFRLPSPSLWRDILEKMKASGYNTVSFYFDWGYHTPKPGVYDFTGVRDLDRLL